MSVENAIEAARKALCSQHGEWIKNYEWKPSLNGPYCADAARIAVEAALASGEVKEA